MTSSLEPRTAAAPAQAARLILLHKDDSVLVCATPLQAGEWVEIDGLRVQVDAPVAMGHKIARYLLVPGSKIIKYGVSVGSATCEVQIGEHVHLHNMRSNYLLQASARTEHGEVK